MDEFDDEKPSKSQRKRDAHALFDLGSELVAQKSALLKQLELPEKLQEAIELAQRTHQHGARKRQLQFIAKLLRGVDVSPIQEVLTSRQESSQMDKRLFHQAEQWRERLLREGDAALEAFLTAFPATDISLLQQLVHASLREQTSGQAPSSARKLFRFVREQLGN